MKAIVFRDKAVAELEARQRNLETLRAEVAALAQEPRIQPIVVSDESDQVSSLKARILQLEREQEDHRQKRARSLSVPSRDLSVLSPNVARVGSSPRQISGSRCTREIESDGEHDCKGRQFGTEFEQVQPTAVRPVLHVDELCGLRGIRVVRRRTQVRQMLFPRNGIQVRSFVGEERWCCDNFETGVRKFESDTESLVGPRSVRPRRRLSLIWADEQGSEVPDSHEERLARVRRQLQHDRPAQVVAMDSSDDSHIVEQQETTRRRGRTIRSGSQVLGFAGLNENLQSLDCQFGECVRGPSHCDEDHSAFSEGHFHECIESKFTGDSTWSTQPESHN